MESASPTTISDALDRSSSVKCWHMDAECRRRLADDFPHTIAVDGSTNANCNKSASVSRRIASGGACGYCRSPSVTFILARLDARCGDGAGSVDVSGCNYALVAAIPDVHAEFRIGDECPSMAG